MTRGEIWTVASGKDYAGKPRPVVIVQDDSFDATDSITICALHYGRDGRAAVATAGAQLQMGQTMLKTKRKPATVGEILVEEFMQPMGLT